MAYTRNPHPSQPTLQGNDSLQNLLDMVTSKHNPSEIPASALQKNYDQQAARKPAMKKSAIETPPAPQKSKPDPYNGKGSQYANSQKFSEKLLPEDKDDLDEMVNAILKKDEVS